MATIQLIDIPKIEGIRLWTAYRVQQACIANKLYTRGDNEAYMEMLATVDIIYPSYENLYLIAKDILEHSIDQTINNIMYILENEAVVTMFSIDDDD